PPGSAGEADRRDRLADLRLGLWQSDPAPVPFGGMQEAAIAGALRVFAGDFPNATSARDADCGCVTRDVAIRHDDFGRHGDAAPDAEPALHALDLDANDAARHRKKRRRLKGT